ncbi:SAM-dependent methyltransferase [Actinomadura formosensis]|uniref:SAM-dependent methyltransferase n=1 Tax=Actinomadura formosensis TaxID=60706 RepID=UPI00082C76BF|nr:SAM-dependent methyltransferase [Actinomadura formosensis]
MGADKPVIDTSVPHSARIWNYWLGGKDNYPVDRQVGDQMIGVFPDIVASARADRVFLGRAVRLLAGERGVDQFLDIGTGLPTVDNTHEVAQRANPASRIVYVDNDPLVLAHARALLTSAPEGETAYLDGDIHDPATILREASRTLDFSRPVGLTLLAIVQFILDDQEAYAAVRTLMEALPPGSYLVLSHGTNEINTQASNAAVDYWNEHGTPPMVLRTAAQIAPFFDGLEILDPGIVACSQWRPEANVFGDPVPVPHYCCVGLKP